MRGRSGLAFRDGIFAHLGTIDSDYRGKIQVLLTKQTEGAKTICHGDRIAQLVIAPVCMDKLIEVDATELSGTSRGKGGFGHTGQ